MKKISLAVFWCHRFTAVAAQQHYSKVVKEQIARVEANVSGGLVIDGKLYSLSERMKHYHLAGLVCIDKKGRRDAFTIGSIS
jgi:hypothetical protein